MDKTEDQPNVPIPEFYKNKTLFITGFTGFVGKVLVEKLLWSCPQVKKIYIILREKKGKSLEERFTEVKSSKAFDRVRKRDGEKWADKVVALRGDLSEDCLGLSDSDQETLCREVEVVFHCAATVRFVDSLKTCIKQNTQGTHSLMELALRMPKLKSFLYMSTAYSNCDNNYIKEEMYPPKDDWRNAINVVNKLDESTLEILFEKYIGTLPNCYVYSKSLGEHVALSYKDRLPLVIIRPSVIVSSLEEPQIGWMDTIYGPVVVTVAFYLGLLRCCLSDNDTRLDFIYLDFVVKASIIAAWKRAYRKSSELQVINACNTEYQVTNRYFGEMANLVTDHDDDKLLQYLVVRQYKSKLWYRINNLFRHVFSAYLVDLVLKFMNKTPLLMKLRRRAFTAQINFHYFSSRTILFENKRFFKLVEELFPSDQNEFSYSCSNDSLDKSYIATFNLCKETFLKELYDNMDFYRPKIVMLYYLDMSMVALTYMLIAGLIYLTGIPSEIFQYCCTFI